jgi:hypothetical protein
LARDLSIFFFAGVLLGVFNLTLVRIRVELSCERLRRIGFEKTGAKRNLWHKVSQNDDAADTFASKPQARCP